MPTYEYKCTVCDDRIEVEQSFSDDALTTLEGCEVDPSGQHQLKKVFAAPGIAFKGSGFYKNDARSSGKSSSSSTTTDTAKKDNGTSSSSDGGGSTKTTSDSKTSSSSTTTTSSSSSSD